MFYILYFREYFQYFYELYIILECWSLAEQRRITHWTTMTQTIQTLSDRTIVYTSNSMYAGQNKLSVGHLLLYEYDGIQWNEYDHSNVNNFQAAHVRIRGDPRDLIIKLKLATTKNRQSFYFYILSDEKMNSRRLLL